MRSKTLLKSIISPGRLALKLLHRALQIFYHRLSDSLLKMNHGFRLRVHPKRSAAARTNYLEQRILTVLHTGIVAQT